MKGAVRTAITLCQETWQSLLRTRARHYPCLPERPGSRSFSGPSRRNALPLTAAPQLHRGATAAQRCRYTAPCTHPAAG
eukprot:4257643-Alexandrium_andersonii.AAC.1